MPIVADKRPLEYLVDANILVNGYSLPDGVSASPGVYWEMKTLEKHGRIAEGKMNTIRLAKVDHIRGADMYLKALEAEAMNIASKSSLVRSGQKDMLSEEDAELVAYAILLERAGNRVIVQTEDRLLGRVYKRLRTKYCETAS